jgi:protein ImuB
MANPHAIRRLTMSQELYACLHVRELPAQALLRLRPEMRSRAVAVVEGEPPLEQVCSANSLALANGALHSMTRVELESIPTITIMRRSLHQESALRSALLECAARFTPRVEEIRASCEYTCMLDIAGSERLLGTPQKIAAAIHDYIQTLGIHAAIVIGSNFNACLCVARETRAPIRIIPQANELASLAPLPVTVLDLAEHHAETLSLWGVRTLGALAALPEIDLVVRFGPAGTEMRQLARGERKHLFVPIEAAPSLEEFIEFDAPVELLDSLLFALSPMLEQLIARVSMRALALSSLRLTLQLEDAREHVCLVTPALPNIDKKLLLKLMHLEISTNPPSAGAMGIRLSGETGPPSKVQLGLFSPQLPEPLRLDVTLARIRAIVGEHYVGSPELKDTHQPDAFRMKRFTVAPAAERKFNARDAHAARRRLRPSPPIAMTITDARPAHFRFRNQQYVIRRAYGPWLASGDWWNTTAWAREEWEVEAEAETIQDAPLVLFCAITHDLVQNIWQMDALYD